MKYYVREYLAEEPLSEIVEYKRKDNYVNRQVVDVKNDLNLDPFGMGAFCLE